MSHVKTVNDPELAHLAGKVSLELLPPHISMLATTSCFANEPDFQIRQVSSWMLREQRAYLDLPNGYSIDQHRFRQRAATDGLQYCGHFYTSAGRL